MAGACRAVCRLRRNAAGCASAAQMYPPPQLLWLAHLLADRAGQCPDASVILAPGRMPLTYSRLWQHVNDIVQTLHAMELNRYDRIALVLPNGPEMAVAVVAMAAGATRTPLHPTSSVNACDSYLAHLGVKALLVQAGTDLLVRSVVQARRLQT